MRNLSESSAMAATKIFLAEFWPSFIGVMVAMFVVWLVKRSRSDARLPFLGAGAFPELAAATKEQQRLWLHHASVLAFRQGRSFVPLLVIALFFAGGFATARVLSATGMIPDSVWTRAAVAAVVAGFGAWLAGKITVRYVRPILRKCMAPDRPPTMEELVGCWSVAFALDERYVVKHFLGKSQAEARRMFAKGGIPITEDFTYMAPAGLRYYLPPAFDYLRAEQSIDDWEFCHGLLCSLYCQATSKCPLPLDVIS